MNIGERCVTGPGVCMRQLNELNVWPRTSVFLNTLLPASCGDG